MATWIESDRVARKVRRSDAHLKAMCELISYAKGHNHFTGAPYRWVRLEKEDITYDLIDRWARLRPLVALYNINILKGFTEDPIPPLYMLAHQIDYDQPPTRQAQTSARKDLEAAVGMCVLINKSTNIKSVAEAFPPKGEKYQ